MKIKKLLKKTLLVAAGLLVGANAWGQTTAFSQDFTDKGSSDPADYGFAAGTCSGKQSATVSDGKFSSSVGAKDGGASQNNYTDYTATFTPIGTGNVVTFTCTWSPGGATGTGKSTLALTDASGNTVLELRKGAGNSTNYQFFVNGTLATTLGSGNNGDTYAVSATINMTTQKITALTVGSIYTLSEPVSFTATSLSKINFYHKNKANWINTATLDNVVVSYEAAASTASVTYKYEDTSGTDLSSLKADVVQLEEVGATISDLITSSLSASFYNGDESIRYDYSTFTCSDATVPAGGTTVTLKFAPKAKFTYNVYAVNSSDVKLQEDPIATATTYEGETATLTWNKYINIGGTWYSTSEGTFRTTETEAGSRNVEYSASDIAYFYEMENLTRSGGAYLTEQSTSYSNFNRLRLSKGSLYYTPALTGGTYLVTIPWQNTNSSAAQVYVYTRSAGGEMSAKLATLEAKGSTTATFTATITVPDGYSIAFNGNEDGSSNNNARMDYMILKSASTVSVTVSSAGYATYVPTCDLDFSDAGIKAYKVKVSEKGKATLTEVDNVPACTPVLLYKAGGATENIPVMTGAAAVTENDLVAGPVAELATIDGDYTNMILNNVDEKIGFYFANGQTVAANRAYLHIATSLAPAAVGAPMMLVFDDDITGINEVQGAGFKVNGYYDLQGRKVAHPTKGLYIVNGKKVVIK